MDHECNCQVALPPSCRLQLLDIVQRVVRFNVALLGDLRVPLSGIGAFAHTPRSHPNYFQSGRGAPISSQLQHIVIRLMANYVYAYPRSVFHCHVRSRSLTLCLALEVRRVQGVPIFTEPLQLSTLLWLADAGQKACLAEAMLVLCFVRISMA